MIRKLGLILLGAAIGAIGVLLVITGLNHSATAQAAVPEGLHAVGAPMRGSVIELKVGPGDSVRRGQPVALLQVQAELVGDDLRLAFDVMTDVGTSVPNTWVIPLKTVPPSSTSRSAAG